MKRKDILNNRLANNMSWLFLLNITNKIIPFLTIPYITRIFQPEGFGVITFSLSFIAFFQVLIDYGFNLSGSRKVAMAEKDLQEVSKIYSAITSIKLIFFLFSVPFILSFIWLYDSLLQYRNIIFIFILLAFSNVLIPTWLFQGFQRVKHLTVISFVVRLGFLISVFTLVKDQKDLEIYAFLYSLSFILIGIFSMLFIRRRYEIKFIRISLKYIRDIINEGFYVFTSSAVVTIMGSIGIMVLGLFYTAEATGYYSAATRINQAVIMFFYPIGQALYPFHCKEFEISFWKGYSSVRRVAKLVIPAFLIISLIMILFREPIVSIILGEKFSIISKYFFLLSFIPLLSIISNLLGTQILVAGGYSKEYSNAFLKGAVVSIVMYFALGYFFGIWGVIVAAVLGEVITILLLYFKVRNIVLRERIPNI